MKNKIKIVSIIFAILTIFSFAGCSKKSKETPVRIGLLTGHCIPVIAQEKGYFKAAGLNNVELYAFGAGPAEIEAFTSGSLDIIHTGDLPALNGIINGLDLNFIGTYSSSDSLDNLIVRDDANIKSFADLRGKKIAVPFGSNIHSLAYEYLERGGVKPEEAEIINLGCADAANALKQGNVDAIVVWQPWGARVAKEPGITILADTSEFRNFVCPISASKKYLDENKDTVTKVLTALDNASKWIKQNPEEAARVAADYYQMKDSDSILIGINSADISIKLTEEKIQAIRLGEAKNTEYGFLRKHVNVDDLVRPEFTANLK